jgi:hypothetical protein
MKTKRFLPILKKYFTGLTAALLVFTFSSTTFAQISINDDGSAPDPSAMLDVKSNDKGFLPPRMTTAERDLISSPADGLVIINTTTNCLEVYFSPAWECLSGSGAPAWTCGDPLVIEHTSGGVSPETKTITYGTVLTNIGGTGDRCWITQNLGAENEAASAFDATDEAAGWYWQFNRIQGFAVGPNPAWVTNSINQNSDWQSANDPCESILGSGWRLPTQNEWNTAQGAWSNAADAYGSDIKLHAAGYLTLASNGGLDSRGTTGYYWSSQQDSNTAAWSKAFNNY